MVTCPPLQIHIVLPLRWDFMFPILPLTLYPMNQWRPLSLLTHLLCLMWKTSRRNPRKRNTPRKCGLAKNRCTLSLSNHTLLLDGFHIFILMLSPCKIFNSKEFFCNICRQILHVFVPLFWGGRGYFNKIMYSHLAYHMLTLNGNKFLY